MDTPSEVTAAGEESGGDHRPADANNTIEQTIDECNKDSGSQSENDKINDETVSNVADTAAARTAEGQAFPDEYAKHIEYNAKGVAIYTDPSTKCKYEFDNGLNQWVPLKSMADEAQPSGSNSATDNPFENEHYRWCHQTNQWVLKDQSAAAASATENEFYKWDEEKQQWIPKTSNQEFDTKFEDGVHTYTDKDGAVFFWDTEKNAWFPRIDDDFMAVYQMSYGFVDNTSSSTPAEQVVQPTTAETNNVEEKKAGGKRKPEAPSNYQQSLLLYYNAILINII